ncbi:hypothetical protein [Halomonas salipaludis]|uniref:Uncharacterized protein n=1 Tax=Halomonas salipaludis TaxID=2032625 RepID=A0A2A2ENM9_9GAMM|nr:hypothetical protein [Halomonas salipaludis]PAU73985.1 hypothetical protein CK498_24775 [Halomonas salipaludis]
MKRENGEQVPRTEGDVADSPLERLRGSVREYRSPFEPVGVEDWAALGLEDDTATPGSSA